MGGKPAEGEDAIAEPCGQQSCHDNRDCAFSDWSSWSACSCTCEGVQHRNRQITTYGAGDGAWCEDALKQLQACNNYSTTPNCKQGEKIAKPCKFDAWGEWGACSATCGGGRRGQSRGFTPPENGGASCDGPLERTQ